MIHAYSRLANLSPLGRGRKNNARRRQSVNLLARSHTTVKQRDQGTCFACGRGAHQVHHRHPRKMGGSNNTYINQPANLISVCTTCHKRIESERVWAINRGYLVPYFRKPEDWPVQTINGHWVLLDNEGTWTEVSMSDLQDVLDGARAQSTHLGDDT